jgi:mannose-6-phosphate isomerase-like protein (cupin superfamily)
MRYLKPLTLAATFLVTLTPALILRAQQRGETLAWAPKPVKANSWIAPNKPHWKLPELLAAHKASASWKETVVSDELLQADYVQMAAGTKGPRQFRPDNRVWWIIQDGQVRFTIQGQEPFVASKGFLVQVPYRNVFSLEVVGDKPALFLEVNAANAQTLYPIDETPVPVPGMEFVKVRISGKGNYDERNKPFLDFNALVASNGRAGAFVVDDRAFANVIRGMPQNDNPKDKGHFHEVSAEFWFVLEGQIEYKIEGLPTFLANQGDVVYVPKQTWHRAHHAGTGYSTRVAMNGYPDLLHDYQPNEELR